MKYLFLIILFQTSTLLYSQNYSVELEISGYTQNPPLYQFPQGRGIIRDANGDFFLVDKYSCWIQKFNSNGDLLLKFGSFGNKDGELSSPEGIAIDSLGNLYVTDYGNNRIQKFSSNGIFILKWGVLGSNDGQFNKPYGIAIDTLGYIYVTDYDNNRIQKFSDDGDFIMKWGSSGNSNGQFNNPTGIAIDSLNHIYIGDKLNHRIQKFTNNGIFITKWGNNGVGNGQFNQVQGLLIDKQNNIYVVDENNNRIQKFTDSGTFLNKFGTYGLLDGQLASPSNITEDSNGNILIVDLLYRVQFFDPSGNFISKWQGNNNNPGQFFRPTAIATDQNGNIFIVENANNRIQKFSSNGTYILNWGTLGSTDGQFRGPTDIAIDSLGNIYICDYYNNRIQKFTNNGVFITKWGSFGTGDGQFKSPTSIEIDRLGNIFVADQSNSRIQKFTMNGIFQFKWGTYGGSNGQFQNPYSIGIDDDNNVYVSDASSYKIQKFRNDGTFVTSWGTNGTGDGEFKAPWGITVDSSNNIYISDFLTNRIQIFDSNGIFLDNLSSIKLNSPIGLYIDKNDILFITSFYSNYFQILKPLQAQFINGINNISTTYGTAPINISASASSSLPITYVSSDPSIASITGSTITILKVGSTSITASQAGDVVYNPAPNVVFSITIAQAPLSITVDNKTKNYGEPNPIFTFSYSGFVNGDDNSDLLNEPTASSIGINAGNHTITATGGVSDNYSFAYTDGIFTINKIPLTIGVNNDSRNVGAANPAFTLTYSGFVNGEDFSVLDLLPSALSPAVSTSAPGNYPINLSGGNDDNYNYILNDGTLTVISNIGPSISVLPPDTGMCYGATVQLDAQLDNVLYRWFLNGTQVSTVKQPILSDGGEYILEVEDGIGNVGRDTCQVHENPEPLDPSFLISYQSGADDVVIVYDVSDPKPDSLQWNWGGGSAEKIGNQYRVTFPFTGTFTIQQTNFLGYCAQSVSDNIEILPGSLFPNTGSLYSLMSLTAAPNPSSGVVQLTTKLELEDYIEVKVYDVYGNVQFSFTSTEAAETHTTLIDMSTWANGTYNARVISSTDMQVLKLEKL